MMMRPFALPLCGLLLSLIAPNVSSFQSAGRPKPASTKAPAPVDEALAIFVREFDFSDKAQGDKTRRLTDISEQDAKASFQALSIAYGSDRAVGMVEALPICLAFDKSSFGPSLKVFQELFGEEEAIAMVERNPGLLAVSPRDAAGSNEQTMAFSYIVAYTRPLGPLLAPFIALFLGSMVFELATGVSLRKLLFE